MVKDTFLSVRSRNTDYAKKLKSTIHAFAFIEENNKSSETCEINFEITRQRFLNYILVNFARKICFYNKYKIIQHVQTKEKKNLYLLEFNK